MNTIANTDTNRTIIIWFLFSKRYFGALENNKDVYIVAIMCLWFCVTKLQFFLLKDGSFSLNKVYYALCFLHFSYYISILASKCHFIMCKVVICDFFSISSRGI